MVTWQNRILALCIPVLLMVACGQGALQQPDLIAGRFQVGTKVTDPTTQLNVIDYYAQTSTGLPAIPDDLATVDASSGTGPWTIFLGFSQFLNGNLIETVSTDKNCKQNDNCFTPVPNSGIIEIWTCPVSSGCLVASNFAKSATAFTLSYRPDGGYIPKPDTPVSNFPPPAVALTFSTALPAASVIAVHVISNTLSNEKNIFMAQVANSNGDKISTPNGSSPVAGTVWFQTK